VLVAHEGIDQGLAGVLERAFGQPNVELVVIEASPSSPGPWTSVPFPKGKLAYATFARWLRAQGFHAGLCANSVFGSGHASSAFLDFSAAGLISVAPGALLDDPEIAARALVVPVGEDWLDLGVVLDRLATAPARYAGLAAASTAYVWKHRSAALVGSMMHKHLRG
jgi:hypothetical protein